MFYKKTTPPLFETRYFSKKKAFTLNPTDGSRMKKKSKKKISEQKQKQKDELRSLMGVRGRGGAVFAVQCCAPLDPTRVVGGTRKSWTRGTLPAGGRFGGETWGGRGGRNLVGP